MWGLKAEKQFADKARLDKSYERMSRKLKQDGQKQKKSNVLRLFSKCIKYAAAVTIIGLLTFNLVQITNENKDVPDNIVVVPKGQRVCLTLSDGSTIWLNAGSRFTYTRTDNTKSHINHIQLKDQVLNHTRITHDLIRKKVGYAPHNPTKELNQ